MTSFYRRASCFVHGRVLMLSHPGGDICAADKESEARVFCS
jgi:hypothetical protein